MLKQNWFASIACPAGFSSFCVFSLFYLFIFFAKITGGPGPPGPSPWSGKVQFLWIVRQVVVIVLPKSYWCAKDDLVFCLFNFQLFRRSGKERPRSCDLSSMPVESICSTQATNATPLWVPKPQPVDNEGSKAPACSRKVSSGHAF